MSRQKPLTNREGEVRELSAEDMLEFRPAHAVLPPSLLKKMGVRGPQKEPTKDRINIRLSHETVAYFRATGDGWQGRIDEALKEWVRSHQAS